MDPGLLYRHDGVKTGLDEIREWLQLLLTIVGELHKGPVDTTKVAAKLKLLARTRVTSRYWFPARPLTGRPRFVNRSYHKFLSFLVKHIVNNYAIQPAGFHLIVSNKPIYLSIYLSI